MRAPSVHRTKDDLRAALAGPRTEGRAIALVPTMGSLHEGHLSLIDAARGRADLVVMSLFVNPTQFGEREDLGTYPRDEERDLRLAGEAGADIVYAPAQAEVYPPGFSTFVEVEGLTDVLCGHPARRGAGHFRGVTTVVAKLLLTATPDFAYFGQKDAQQALVIRRMVRDLDFPVKVVVMPTVREPDGLAMSSRNAYLVGEERERATALSQALAAVAHAAGAGTSVAQAIERAGVVLTDAGITPEYLEARHADDLSPASNFNGRPVLVAVAAQVGRTRLIDNLLIAGTDQSSAD
ncbi:MAG: pantoate--beta-alanine ligase [Actinomycetota bacterium]|nr:pantoate--beta-alanine ligase [Actinomycetota bacterium]